MLRARRKDLEYVDIDVIAVDTAGGIFRNSSQRLAQPNLNGFSMKVLRNTTHINPTLSLFVLNNGYSKIFNCNTNPSLSRKHHQIFSNADIHKP